MQGRRHGRGVWTPLKPAKMHEGEESIDQVIILCSHINLNPSPNPNLNPSPNPNHIPNQCFICYVLTLKD